LKLAKILHHKGFHITFVNTEFNHRRFLRSRGPHSLDGLLSFRFVTIPDGLPPSDADATQDIPSLNESTTKTCLGPFRELLAKLNGTNNTSNVPPVTCIVSDGIMSFTLAAAQEIGVPEVQLWTTSACGFLGYMHYTTLIEKGYAPLKDVSYLTNGYLETTLDCIPGMKDVRLRDLPTLLREYAHIWYERARNASAIILNTFETLESEVLESLRTLLPPVYPIGPLHLLVKHVDDENLKGLGSSLWKEEPECLQWLDTKEPNSVVYVNYGSITVMTPDQLIEFAWGLANSQQEFLWIIRPDIVSGYESILPPEFVEETKNRGMLASWCSQEEVLNHPAIGGFLTHSGWNSTLESITSGVPMLCWPFFAEQQTNCWFSETKWGIGMEIDNNVKRDEVESLVRELMVGEKGKEMKKKAMEWKKLAEISAQKPTGSSYMNIDKVVNDVLL
ncbi:hypothetical protein EJD97_000173, partial [Solanum chilense]